MYATIAKATSETRRSNWTSKGNCPAGTRRQDSGNNKGPTSERRTDYSCMEEGMDFDQRRSFGGKADDVVQWFVRWMKYSRWVYQQTSLGSVEVCPSLSAYVWSHLCLLCPYLSTPYMSMSVYLLCLCLSTSYVYIYRPLMSIFVYSLYLYLSTS